MARMVLAMVLTCAVLHLGAAHAPPYAAALQRTNNCYDYFLNTFHFQTPTPAQYGMVAFTSIAHDVAASIVSGASYEEAYSVDDIIRKLHGIDAIKAGDFMLQVFNKGLAKMRPIQNLVNALCTGSTNNCDQLVDATVRSNPSYAGPAALVLEFGALSTIFNAIRPQVEWAALSGSGNQYAARSKLELKPFVTKTADVMRTYHSIH